MLTWWSWFVYCELLGESLYDFLYALPVDGPEAGEFNVGFDEELRRLCPHFYAD